MSKAKAIHNNHLVTLLKHIATEHAAVAGGHLAVKGNIVLTNIICEKCFNFGNLRIGSKVFGVDVVVQGIYKLFLGKIQTKIEEKRGYSCQRFFVIIVYSVSGEKRGSIS